MTVELTGLADLGFTEGLLPTLTPRQATVLRARAQGLSNREITSKLNISISTVEKAITEINIKFTDYLKRAEPARSFSPPASTLAATFGYGPGDLLDPEVQIEKMDTEE